MASNMECHTEHDIDHDTDHNTDHNTERNTECNTERDLTLPPEQIFDTYKELEATVQSFAKDHEYAIAIGRSHSD